jgi:PPK2 family polyphosphate:nucleotide phosphotransferase
VSDEAAASHDLRRFKLRPVDPKKRIRLGAHAARVKHAPDRAELRDATDQLLTKLTALQDAFHADGRRALLLVLQGRDASGKDGTIRTVYGAFNPTGVTVAPFGPPTALELRHDFLWRVHPVVPPLGMIGVFNRSHYEDVLAVRVRKLVPESVWRARFAQINAFERLLHESGVIVRKCMLHVSRDEQRARFQARLEDPRKNWKFRPEDLEDRSHWTAFTEAYREVLTECSTPWAPWYVVPSDDKQVRNYLIARMLVETLESLNPEYPPMQASVRQAAEGFA